MKKQKAYRPRRSLRISNGIKGGPAASFVGGPAITRPRKTARKINLALRKYDSVVTTGSVQLSITGPKNSYCDPTQPMILSSSIFIEGAVSTGRSYERRKLNAKLLGLPVGAVGRPPWPSTAVQDIAPTGTFASPSWTHASIGINQAFVGLSLTSSYLHETKTLNYFRSGTQPIESSPVPASSSLFYSKEVKLQTVIVKHSASITDTVATTLPSWITVPSSFSAGSGSLVNTVTGSIGSIACSTTHPAFIPVNVSVSGRLVDIKVWVEVFHVTGTTGPALGSLGLSLRAPALSWGHAHPIKNDKRIRVSLDYNPVIDEFYKDSFILWEGTTIADQGTSAASNWAHFVRGRYPTWNTDFCMRTVFADCGSDKNPRELYAVNPSGSFQGSPNASLAINSAYGCNVPWISDPTIGSGTYGATGSPPKGWLTGPASTANTNEWPTTGSNLGAVSLRPLYPLIDPIFSKKFYSSDELVGVGSAGWGPDFPISRVYDDWQNWSGFRPGLRGTEISGTWYLMVAAVNDGGTAPNTYFRQVRLEITYETNRTPTRVRNGSSVRPQKPGPSVLYFISGSDTLSLNVGGSSTGIDYFVNAVCVDVPTKASVGRTFGLVLNSGSIGQPDCALLYRLDGALSDISGSAPGWLLNNRFRMPSIPISSASLALPVSSSIDSLPIGKFISPRKTLDGPRHLSDVASDVNPSQSRVQMAASFISSSAS